MRLFKSSNFRKVNDTVNDFNAHIEFIVKSKSLTINCVLFESLDGKVKSFRVYTQMTFATDRPTCARAHARYAHALMQHAVRSVRTRIRFTVAGRATARRTTAHNYSYAIHQLVFMVKVCVLTLPLDTCTCTHQCDGCARSSRTRKGGASLPVKE